MKNIFLLILSVLFLTSKGYTMNDNNKSATKNAYEVCPVKISEQIPSAIVQNIEGRSLDIRDITKGKNSIIIFYRGGWCPYCNLQLSGLQKVEGQLIDLGYNIVAISMDNPEHLKATLDKYQMKYELYSDSKANASKAFGIAFKVDDDYVSKLKQHNLDIENASGQSHHILPVPSVFIVDGNGVIQFEYVNPDYKIRINEKLLLEAAKIYLKN